MKVGSKHEINNKTNNNDDDKDKTSGADPGGGCRGCAPPLG